MATYFSLEMSTTGAMPTFARASIMLGSFFVLCDYCERFMPDLMAVPLLGGFIKGGVCATAGWAVAWPFEVVKSMVQGADGAKYRGMTSLHIMRQLVAAQGILALWRGMGRRWSTSGLPMA